VEAGRAGDVTGGWVFASGVPARWRRVVPWLGWERLVVLKLRLHRERPGS
jgi:hypothetical protein